MLPREVAGVPQRGSKDFLYALDDVSFEVPAGEVLGIIGRNGAGKSTLLRILARVLDPTEGRITLRGRAVSLLDLGIGFAPDLTVRENIHIYGRLSGFSARRVRAVEDKILSAAGLTDFSDVLLENCPSGSFVQLGFAAMMSLDAEIILADEVLTVGDSRFRRACEERILAAGKSGESVLLVSHDMNAIKRCCSRVLWIDKGRVRQIGATEEVVNAYTTELLAGRLIEPACGEDKIGCRILELRLLDADREQVGALQMTEASYIDCLLLIDRGDIVVNVQIELWDGRGRIHILTCTTPTPLRARRPTTYRAGIRVPAHFFNEMTYQARCRVYVQNVTNLAAAPTVAAEERLEFSVMNPHPEKSVWADWTWGRGGIISPRLQWSVASREAPLPVVEAVAV